MTNSLYKSLFFTILFFCGVSLFSAHTFAKGTVADTGTVTDASTAATSTNSSDQINNDGNLNFKPKNIPLREPMLPGQNTIDINPNTSGGSIGIMSAYVTMIYKYVLALGSIVAVLVIMFGGIKMMTSGGDSGATGEAKTMIMRTLSGLAMLFLTGLFLYAINPNFFVFSGESTATTISATNSNGQTTATTEN